MKYLFAFVFVMVMGTAIPFDGRAAQEQELAALRAIEPGNWDLRSRADSSANRSICVTDPTILLKLQHSTATCSRFVIYNDQRMATVHYSCANAGNVRTSVRVETPRLVQIDSQGTINREPFSVQLEGRRTGGCGASKSNFRR